MAPVAFGQFIQPPKYSPPTPTTLVNNLIAAISSFDLVNGIQNSWRSVKV